MTPSDLYFVCCLVGFFTWLSVPLSERRAPKARTQAKRRRTNQVKARTKKPKAKRTKVKKQKRYNAVALSVDDQIRYDQYLYKKYNVETWNSGESL
jgi:hypothetical protein